MKWCFPHLQFEANLTLPLISLQTILVIEVTGKWNISTPFHASLYIFIILIRPTYLQIKLYSTLCSTVFMFITIKIIFLIKMGI